MMYASVYAESFTVRLHMDAPKKRLSLLSFFLLAFFARFFSSFLFPPFAPLAPEAETLIFALLYGIFASLPKVFILWCYAKYFPQYLLEILIVCLGFLAALGVQMVFLEEIVLWYVSVATLVHLAVILGTYHLVVRKMNIKKSTEQDGDQA